MAKINYFCYNLKHFKVLRNEMQLVNLLRFDWITVIENHWKSMKITVRYIRTEFKHEIEY